MHKDKLAEVSLEALIAILMTQVGFPSAMAVYLDFWTAVYQALDD